MSPKSQPAEGRKDPALDVSSVVPQGRLRKLQVSEIKRSLSNPRRLFDKNPLAELKESIRQHGVLVPITVFQIKGQKSYKILDGERRYRCCAELEEAGHRITIPANVVDPPDKIAGILYMFSIHNYRESWELMPTALSLRIVMEALGEQDTKTLSKLSGLGEMQIERCKILLSFPEKFQDLSLDPDPKTRIPSNFWIEAYPVLNLCDAVLPDLVESLGRNGIIEQFIEKYRNKRIKSVIHFRRIMEAFEIHSGDADQRTAVVRSLRSFITEVQLETRASFDQFVMDNRRIQSVISACEEFVNQLVRSKLEHALEKDELIVALKNVNTYIDGLIDKLKGSEEPNELADRRDAESSGNTE